MCHKDRKTKLVTKRGNEDYLWRNEGQATRARPPRPSHAGCGRKGFQREQRGQLCGEDCVVEAVALAADLREPTGREPGGMTLPPLSCLYPVGWSRLDGRWRGSAWLQSVWGPRWGRVEPRSGSGETSGHYPAQLTMECFCWTFLWAYPAEHGFWALYPQDVGGPIYLNVQTMAWLITPPHRREQWLNIWLEWKNWKEQWRAEVSDGLDNGYLVTRTDTALPGLCDKPAPRWKLAY